MISYGTYPINNSKIPTFMGRPIAKKVIESTCREFHRANKIGIFPHDSPDPDAIATSMLIYDELKGLGKEVSIYVNPEAIKGLVFDSSKYKINQGLKHDTLDLGIVLDCNEEARLPQNLVDAYRKSKRKIGLDHHKETKNSINGLYIDSDAHSCCGVALRFFEGISKKLKQADWKKIGYGMFSDYIKSGLLVRTETPEGVKFITSSALETDANKYSKEVLDSVEAHLSKKNKNEIYKSLDVISNLKPEESAFRKKLCSKIEITSNKKIAYIIIDPDDKDWAKLGLSNIRTKTILADLRQKMINPQDCAMFSEQLKENLKDVKGAVIFYKTSGIKGISYNLSATSKDGFAELLIEDIKDTVKNPNMTGGGHLDRVGGRVFSCEKKDVDNFITKVLTTAESL